MARKVSKKLRERVEAEASSSIIVCLITLHHTDWVEPVRVSSDATEQVGLDQYHVMYGTKSRGNIYYYAGFEWSFPNDEDGASQKIQVQFPNADPVLLEHINDIRTNQPILCDFEIVLADAPDIVDVSFYGMQLVHIKWNENNITGELTVDMLFQEPFPCRTFNPQDFPFLFLSRSR